MIKAIKILNELINSTVHTVTVNGIVDNGDNTFTLSTPFTYYLKDNSPIVIDSISYKVVSFVMNESLTLKPLKGTTPVTATSFIIPPPTFLHGTPTAANNEYVRTKSNPFIWVLEFLEADYNNSTDSPVKGTFDFDIFFLTDVPQGDWLVTDHYEKAIYPMNNEIDYFLKILNDRIDLFGDIEGYKVINHVNFGNYVVNKGYDKKIIEANLSGSQLKISIPYITEDCECGCPLIDPINTCVPAIARNSNGAYAQTIESGGVLVLPDVTITECDGSDVIIPAQTPFTCTPPLKVGIAYKRTNYTGMATQYATNDDKWRLINGFYNDTTPENPTHVATLDVNNLYPNHFLLKDNEFGNKSRFTDLNGNYYTNPYNNTSGTSVNMYDDNYMIDHLTGYGWGVEPYDIMTWSDTILIQVPSLVIAGFSDFVLPSINEVLDLSIWQTQSLGLGYYPFNILNTYQLWTSTTSIESISDAVYYQQIDNLIPVNINLKTKTSLTKFIAMRKHY